MYCEEHIRWINQNYQKSYHVLNKNIKKIVNNKRIFIGSRDELGYYQPDLTDYLIDNNSRRGRFVNNISSSKNYFEYWYSDNDLIKIKYITNDYYENYDVIVEREDKKLIYLFYSLDYNGDVSLSNFYILTYDDKNLITLDKYIKMGHLDKYQYSGAEYFYKHSRLYKAVTIDCFSQKEFNFEYNRTRQTHPRLYP